MIIDTTFNQAHDFVKTRSSSPVHVLGFSPRFLCMFSRFCCCIVRPPIVSPRIIIIIISRRLSSLSHCFSARPPFPFTFSLFRIPFSSPSRNTKRILRVLPFSEQRGTDRLCTARLTFSCRWGSLGFFLFSFLLFRFLPLVCVVVVIVVVVCCFPLCTRPRY